MQYALSVDRVLHLLCIMPAITTHLWNTNCACKENMNQRPSKSYQLGSVGKPLPNVIPYPRSPHPPPKTTPNSEKQTNNRKTFGGWLFKKKLVYKICRAVLKQTMLSHSQSRPWIRALLQICVQDCILLPNAKDHTDHLDWAVKDDYLQ